ncbi:MAG: hypothetical protein ACHP7O_06200 [Burkholderiales bacterium]
MNNARRLLLLVWMAGFLALIAGCTTPAIEASHHYTEKVSSLLISKDKQKIVFIGTVYHYIFDAPANLVKSLELPFKDKISGVLSNFHVDKNGMVTGLYSLQFTTDLSADDRNMAILAGFQPNAAGQLALAGKITGARYHKGDIDKKAASLAESIRGTQIDKVNLEKDAAVDKLNKTYTITFTYDPTNGEKVADAMISPGSFLQRRGIFFILYWCSICYCSQSFTIMLSLLHGSQRGDSGIA